MKKTIFTLTAMATAFLMSFATPLKADTTFIQGGIGYRQDSITLNVKERSSINPRAKSDRHFKDLEIFVLGGQLKSTLGSYDAYVRGSFDYGFVVDGKLRNSLLIQDRNELFEFRRSGYTSEGEYLCSTVHNTVKDNSYVWDLNIAFAYPFSFGCDGLQFAPAVGFSWDRQRLHVKGAPCQTNVELFQNDLENFGLTGARRGKSTYCGSWWGPWLGFDFAYNTATSWNVYGAFEFHFGRARRQTSSHTERDYIDQYRRTKAFYGPLFRLGASYMLTEHWYADAHVTYWKYFSSAHRDHLAWGSGSIRFDAGYVF